MRRMLLLAALAPTAATGAEFTDGKASSEAVLKTCFGRHAPAKANDFVFTRYAP
jgi:hypothetical protein